MEIRDYVTPILKWWWLIALSTLVAGGSSYYATLQQPLRYQSTATLSVGSALEELNPNSGDLYLTQQLAKFYVDMAGRSSVRQNTMDALGLNWLPEIYVRNVDNLIDIIVIDTDPQRAQAVAAELTRQLILRSPASQQRDLERREFIDRQLDNYQAAILEAQADIEEKQQELLTLTSAREISEMQTEINELSASLYDLEKNYAALLSGTQQGATNSISVIEPATFPNWPIDSKNTTTILMSAAIGLVLAGSAAYLLEYLDDSIRTPEALSRITQLPTLTAISNVQLPGEKELVTIAQPRSPTSEAFRALRTAVQFSAPVEDNKVLLVTSGSVGEGKSTISSNLAVVLAQAGHKVLLIDADLRHPAIHTVFGISHKRGLTNILLEYRNNGKGGDELTDLVAKTVMETRVSGLEVLASGPLPPNPSELLGSKYMIQILNGLAFLYDYIVLDSPPALSVTDAVILGSRADAVLLVVRSGKSRKASIRQTVDKFREINARVLGCVLNGIEPSKISSVYGDPYLADGEETIPSDDGQKIYNWVRERLSRRQAT